MLRLATLLACLVASSVEGKCPFESDFVDVDTDDSQCYRTNALGQKLVLVFSDEFNKDGRTFADGDDPVWTGLKSMPSTNEQINEYTPDNAHTKDGLLRLEVSLSEGDAERPYRTAMLQTWNKFCFTGGTVEIRARMPGKSSDPGLWPAFWLMGNLGRATFTDSTNGLWPYSFDKCIHEDEGPDYYANQMHLQKISACDVQEPWYTELDLGNGARGAPEIDIIEMLSGKEKREYSEKIDDKCCPETWDRIKDDHELGFFTPSVCTSQQLAPGFPKGSKERPPLAQKNLNPLCTGGCIPQSDTSWYPRMYPDPNLRGNGIYGDTYKTRMNYEFTGEFFGNENGESSFQTDALSACSQVGGDTFESFQTYRLEHKVGPEGHVKFYLEDSFLFKVEASDIDQVMAYTSPSGRQGKLYGRKIPDEPMYMILNVDVSPRWGWPGCDARCPSCCNDCQNETCTTCYLPSDQKPFKYYNSREWLKDLCTSIKNKVALEVDYIRIYQPADTVNQIGCNPQGKRTNSYIGKHGDRYLQSNDVEPLHGIRNGGGRCRSDADCGNTYDRLKKCLVNGVCDKCSEGWTGPKCLVRAISQTQICAELSKSPSCNVDSVDGIDSSLSYDELMATVNRMCKILHGVQEDITACRGIQNYRYSYFDCSLKEKANHVIATFQKLTEKDGRAGKCCNKIGRNGYCESTGLREGVLMIIYLTVVLLSFFILYTLFNCSHTHKCSNRQDVSSDTEISNNSEEETDLKNYTRARNIANELKDYTCASDIANEEALHKEISQSMRRLKQCFGFQNDSVVIQRRHVKHLIKSYLGEGQGPGNPTKEGLRDAITRAHRKLLAGFRKWLQSLGLDQEFTKHGVECLGSMETELKDLESKGAFVESEVRLLHEICLFLLCWSEADVMRFLPEFICFVFYCARHAKPEKSAQQLDFLKYVLTPMYVAMKSAMKTEDEDMWATNFDDLNEFFWEKENIRGIVSSPGEEKQPFRETKGAREQKRGWYNELKHHDWKATLKNPKTFNETTGWLSLLRGYHRVAIIQLFLFGILVSGAAWPWSVTFEQYYNALVAPVILDIIVRGYNIYARTSPDDRSLFSITIFILYITFFVLWALELSGDVHIPQLAVALCFSILLTHSLFFKNLLSIVDVTVCNAIRRGTEKLGWCRCACQSGECGGTASKTRPLDDNIWVEPWKWWRGFSYWIFVYVIQYTLSRNVGMHAFEQTRQLSQFADRSVRTSADSMEIFFHLLIYWVAVFIIFAVQTRLIAVLVAAVFGYAYAVYARISIPLQYSFSFCGPDCSSDIFKKLPLRVMTNILGYEMKDGDNYLAVMRTEFRKTWNEIVARLHASHLLRKKEKEDLHLDGGAGVELWESIEEKVENLEPEAKRRLMFFARSARHCTTDRKPMTVQGMPSFTVLVPHYKDPIIFEESDIYDQETNSIHKNTKHLFEYHRHDEICLQENFPENERENRDEYVKEEYIKWTSMREQTLYRTLVGMLEYKRALEFRAHMERQRDRQDKVWGKYQLLVTMQLYGQNAAKSAQEDKIRDLMLKHPTIEIACVNKVKSEAEKQFSYLMMTNDKANNLLEEEDERPENDGEVSKFEIELPGPSFKDRLGQGKALNHNHALKFAIGAYIQTIDANQEMYFEEALKLLNILTEFRNDRIAMLGLREHIFSSQVGTCADFAGRSELVFGTLTQRVLNLLEARLHYGHPDIMDKCKMMEQGGLSSASQKINLNEDIFAGMNAILRGAMVHFVEYMQVGKARDMGFLSIMEFYRKLGRGAGNQATTRQHARLGSRLHLSRTLSIYYGHLGFYLNHYLYGVAFWMLSFFYMYSVLSDYSADSLEEIAGAAQLAPGQKYGARYETIAESMVSTVCNSLLILFLCSSAVPAFLVTVSERGIFTAIKEVVFLQNLTLAPLFFSFQSRLVGHEFKIQLLIGADSNYIATGRRLQIDRNNFAQLYSVFVSSHMLPAFEIFSMILTIFILKIHRRNLESNGMSYFWALVSINLLSWFGAPFLYNPNQMTCDGMGASFRELIGWLFCGKTAGEYPAWGDIANKNSRLENMKKTSRKVEIQQFVSLLAPCVVLGYVFFQKWHTLSHKAAISKTEDQSAVRDFFWYIVAFPLEPFALEFIFHVMRFANFCTKGEDKGGNGLTDVGVDGDGSLSVPMLQNSEEGDGRNGGEKEKFSLFCVGQQGSAFLADVVVGCFVYLVVCGLFLLFFIFDIPMQRICGVNLHHLFLFRKKEASNEEAVDRIRKYFGGEEKINLQQQPFENKFQPDSGEEITQKLTQDEKVREMRGSGSGDEKVHHYGNRISHTSFFKPRVLWALLYLISTVAGLCYVVQVPIFYQYPSIILIGYWVRYFSHQLGIYFLSLLLNNFKCCSKKEENENGKKKIKDEKLFEPQKQSFLERSLNK